MKPTILGDIMRSMFVICIETFAVDNTINMEIIYLM